MPILNALISWYFKSRFEQIVSDSEKANSIQEQTLSELILKASGTEIGKQYKFYDIKDYQDFASRIPITNYDQNKALIERMMAGEQNILWPSEITWFAKSSGTTSDKSKFIPVSNESLNQCHFQGGRDALSVYVSHNPNSKLFSGKGLLIGGSHNVSPLNENTFFGDLSAVMMKQLPLWVHMFKTPNSQIALHDDWIEKVEQMAHYTIKENVTNISGVPTWTAVLFDRILDLTGKKHMHEIWPNLELFVHGGVNFAPYRKQFQEYLPAQEMNYLETYNATEGFFGIQVDPNDQSLYLMPNYGIFYEFVPMHEYGSSNARAIPLWEVQTQVDYAVIITSNAGLWRYDLGDTIRFTQLRPYTFIITGRTKLFINAFGEELMIHQADQAVMHACEMCHAIIKDYTAGPVYLENSENSGHEWLFEFETPPDNMEAFAHHLDTKLKELNSDYESKRYGNLLINKPKIVVLPQGAFHGWMQTKGKLGGQHKVPRLWNDRSILEELLGLSKTG